MKTYIQWMIVVPEDAPQELLDLLTTKIGQAVEVARREYPTDEVKYAVLQFQETEF